jgi:hypothetical protein
MKQGVLLRLLSNCFKICHLEYSSKPEGLKLNGTGRLMGYADDVNLL